MFNDHDLLEFLLVAAPGLLATTVLFAVLWVRARERALRSQVSPRRSDASTEELTHVVHAVDAIAIEVERISEAHASPRWRWPSAPARSGSASG